MDKPMKSIHGDTLDPADYASWGTESLRENLPQMEETIKRLTNQIREYSEREDAWNWTQYVATCKRARTDLRKHLVAIKDEIRRRGGRRQ